MKTLLFTIITFFSSNCIKNKANMDDKTPNIAILKAKENGFELSKAEIAEIETLFKASIAEREKQFYDYDAKFPKKVNKNEYVLKPINAYSRQYVATINEKGEKQVLINCFCDGHEFPNWQTELVVVFDGGNCYFELTINLLTKKTTAFYVNGEA
jgi:hypothetical protein